MSFNVRDFVGTPDPASIEARLEMGRELLYDEESGLYAIASRLIDEEPQNPLLPHEEKYVLNGETRIELYRAARSGSRGLSIRRVIGGRTLNTETNTIVVPSPGVFATPEHQLHRLGANNQLPPEYGGNIMKPPVVITNRTALVDEWLLNHMDHFLRDYLTTAQTITHQLSQQ